MFFAGGARWRLTFGTKAAILSEALGAAITGFDDWTGEPPEPFDTAEAVDILPWYRRFEAEPDPRRALAISVNHGFDALARVAPLVRVLHAVSCRDSRGRSTGGGATAGARLDRLRFAALG